MFSVYKSYTLALYKKQIRSAVCFLCKAMANYYTIAQVGGWWGGGRWTVRLNYASNCSRATEEAARRRARRGAERGVYATCFNKAL